MKLALTFDDIALVPKYNNVASRTEPSLTTWFTKDLETGIPIIPANMDTVIGQELANIMYSYSGRVIMHRFCSYEEKLKWAINNPYPFLSSGVKQENIDETIKIINESRDQRDTPFGGVCFDIAHGHCKMMLESIKRIKDFCPSIRVIAGNVCTSRAFHDLALTGADAIKVGIGGGSACLTRVVTGFGIPQFTAIRDCAKIANELRVPLIADGGIRNSRDIVLALAAGASTVMVGKLFALTEASAAEKRLGIEPSNYKEISHLRRLGYTDDQIKEGWDYYIKEAKYRGQASEDFQDEFYGGLKKGTVPEGDSAWLPVTGTSRSLIEELLGGLRSGLTYAGARTIKELQRKAEFVQVTSNYMSESKTRLK